MLMTSHQLNEDRTLSMPIFPHVMNDSSDMLAIDPVLEAQYNARAAVVPEHPAIFARWQARSEAFRAQADCRLDLTYGPGAWETLDFFVAGAALSPLHIFLHGGYLASGGPGVARQSAEQRRGRQRPVRAGAAVSHQH